MTTQALPIAAPSCVLPATVSENAFFLAHKVQEIGICFFETGPCLAYTEKDLPQELSSLPVRWHIHLPVDLPWNKGGTSVASIALSIMQKALYLKARYAVLHPPAHASLSTQEKLLQDFSKQWYKNTNIPVLLENINNAPLTDLNPALFSPSQTQQKKTSNIKASAHFGVCLDLAHMLAFKQHELAINAQLLSLVQLIHISAPDGADKHKDLSYLTPSEIDSIKKILPMLPKNATHMLEIFQWEGIATSYPLWKKLLWSAAHEKQ